MSNVDIKLFSNDGIEETLQITGEDGTKLFIAAVRATEHKEAHVAFATFLGEQEKPARVIISPLQMMGILRSLYGPRFWEVLGATPPPPL